MFAFFIFNFYFLAGDSPLPSALPNLPEGLIVTNVWVTSLLAPLVMGVSINPGNTQFTLMPFLTQEEREREYVIKLSGVKGIFFFQDNRGSSSTHPAISAAQDLVKAVTPPFVAAYTLKSGKPVLPRMLAMLTTAPLPSIDPLFSSSKVLIKIWVTRKVPCARQKTHNGKGMSERSNELDK